MERRQDEHISKLVLHRRVRPGKFTARDWQFKTPEILEKDRKSPLESAFNEYEIYNQKGELVMTMKGIGLMRRRTAA